MAAPLGNRNSAKGRLWAKALEAALAQYTDDRIKCGEALDVIARNVIIAALAGDWDAVTEIGNRLDGKPAQALQVSDGDGMPLGLLVSYGRTVTDSRVSEETRMPLSS